IEQARSEQARMREAEVRKEPIHVLHHPTHHRERTVAACRVDRRGVRAGGLLPGLLSPCRRARAHAALLAGLVQLSLSLTASGGPRRVRIAVALARRIAWRRARASAGCRALVPCA